jgi:hypothetical protein
MTNAIVASEEKRSSSMEKHTHNATATAFLGIGAVVGVFVAEAISPAVAVWGGGAVAGLGLLVVLILQSIDQWRFIRYVDRVIATLKE